MAGTAFLGSLGSYQVDMLKRMLKEMVDQKVKDLQLGQKVKELDQKLWEQEEKLEEQDQKLKELNQKLEEKDQQLEEQDQKLKVHEEHILDLRLASLGRSEKELVTCAHEIWKRNLHCKIGEAIGDGKQLFDPNVQDDIIMRTAIAMGMVDQIPKLKEMSRICIVAGQGSAAHFPTLKSLEDSVGSCLQVMQIFPSLQQSHLHEFSIVSHYQRFKQLFPRNFRD